MPRKPKKLENTECKNIIAIKEITKDIIIKKKPIKIHLKMKINDEIDHTAYKMDGKIKIVKNHTMSKEQIKMIELLSYMKKKGISCVESQGCIEIEIVNCNSWKECIKTLLMICYFSRLDTDKELTDFVAYMIRPLKGSSSGNVEFNLIHDKKEGYVEIPTIRNYKELYVKMQEDAAAHKEYLIKIMRWLNVDEKESYIEIGDSYRRLFRKYILAVLDEKVADSVNLVEDRAYDNFWLREINALKKHLETADKMDLSRYKEVEEQLKCIQGDVVDYFFMDTSNLESAPSYEEYEKMGYGKLHVLFPSFNKGVGVFSLNNLSRYMHHICMTDKIDITDTDIKNFNSSRNSITHYYYVAFEITDKTYKRLVERYPALKRDIVDAWKSGKKQYVVTDAVYMGKYY